MPVQIQYVKRQNGRLNITSPDVLKDDDGIPFASIADYCAAHDDDTFFMNLQGDARAAVLGGKDTGTGELFALASESDNGWCNTLALLIERPAKKAKNRAHSVPFKTKELDPALNGRGR